MKFFSSIIALFSVTVSAAGLKLEATDGEDVTICFETAGLERAERVTITRTRDNQKTVIARYCRCGDCGDCNAVETPGVLLQAEEVTLTLLSVNSSNSGLYEAKIIAGNSLFKRNATLIVNAFSPSTAQLHTSTPKPPNSPEHRWWYALLIPGIILPVIIFGVVFRFCRREREPRPDVEEARNTPAVSRLGKNCSDFVAVSFKACTEDTDEKLVDT